MTIWGGVRAGTLVVLCGGAALATACADVIGFPDRTLGDGSGNTPSGPANAAFSKTALDFGLVPCGGEAPPEQKLTITNLGAEPLTWSATLSETPEFSISGPAGGTLGGGETATISIAAIAVPATTDANDTAQATLTIESNDANKPKTGIPIKRVAGGGKLEVLPITADFGESPINVAAADVPITVKNEGNQPVTVELGQPETGDAEASPFTLSWAGAPAPVTVEPGKTVPGLVAKFMPTQRVSMVATAPIKAKGPICGTSAAMLTLSGKGAPSTASVQPGSLDFGMVDCGKTAAPKTVNLLNTGTQEFTWTATLTGTEHYTLSETSGSVAPGATKQITVTSKPIPGTSPITPNHYGGMLTITTSAPGDEPHVLEIHQTARGAILTQSTAQVNFGSVRVTSTATSPFTVVNSGNAPATVSYAVNNPIFALSPAANVVTGGATYQVTASFTPPAELTYNATATMSVSDTVLCGPLPAALTLTGRGAKSASLSPTNVDFGQVNCNTQAQAKTVTFTNIGLVAFSWTATVGTNNYTINPKTGVLMPGASANITITPIRIPATSETTADLYADVLRIETTPSLESPYVASLHMTARGARLSFNPTSIDFGQVREGDDETRSFSVINGGNVAAAVTLSASGQGFSVSPTSRTVNGGSSFTASARFKPSSEGPKNGSISASTNAPLCAPLPAPLSLKGTGKKKGPGGDDD